LYITAKSTFRALVAVALLLVIASTGAKAIMLHFPAEQYGALHEVCARLYLDFENNIPAWYSSTCLFVAAALFGLSAAVHWRAGDRSAWYWAGLALIFLYLSADEAAYVHEILIVPIRRRLNLSGMLYFSWVVPGSIVVAGVGLIYFRFLLRLQRATRNGLLLAGCIYVGGALGLELVGGMLAESQGFDSPLYIAAMTIEEFCEILGVSVLIATLVGHLAKISDGRVILRFGRAAGNL
jgi:hypothetical protein